ncbi:DUF1641 domain-containing protein [Haloarcula marina]|uniref:DUF1641 domain-containing protein n=1 Tax=Haloarcula marina TaxID=2961574 RepID=UPI0020B65C9E|nr:DUF1641 domain-containing protein [Halomicroarcula marina]
MADPQRTVPEEATNRARKERPSTNGETALEDALAAHGEELAAAVEASDELDDALTTAILVAATADEEEIANLTQSAAHLVEAADGLTTEGAAALATQVGDDADELSAAVDAVVELEREGHLDRVVDIGTTLSESLSDEQLAQLGTLLEEDGTDLFEALDVVLSLQREGNLEPLIDNARALSALRLDAETVAGVDTVLGALGEAQHESEPMGLLGAVSALRSRDARAGLGYLVTLLKAQGRRVRER